MNPFRLLRFLALAAALLPALQAADSNSTSVNFSDPSKPGTVRVQGVRGDIRIQGADTPQITVRSDATPVPSAPRADGMRVLTASSSIAISEKNNVVVIDTSDGGKGGQADVVITVPRATNVVVSNAIGSGDITCIDIAGDIEIDSLHGEVKLEGIQGGALVTTLNGEIQATVAQFNDKKPVSLSSLNGEVELTVPGATKANVKLRTQNGTILTNFDDTVLVTKIENTPRGSADMGVDLHQALEGAAQASAVAIQEAKEAARAAADSIRAGFEGDQEKPRANPPRPPRLPRKTIPAMTGGKLVSGTLNGGGPEISIVTMNGDVVLRKIEAQARPQP